VLTGRGLWDELITRSEESHRLWCVVVCDLETSLIMRSLPTGGLSRQKQTTNVAYLQKKKKSFFGFSAYPKVSSSQLNRIRGVLLCLFQSPEPKISYCCGIRVIIINVRNNPPFLHNSFMNKLHGIVSSSKSYHFLN